MKNVNIKWLDIKDMKILKQIIIVSDRQFGEVEIGRILYTRPLTEDYNLKKQQEESDKQTDSLAKFFPEFPAQKNYPVDRIDEILLAAVRALYPKSIVRNDTILFDIDQEKIEVLKNREILKSSIYFSPEFSNYFNLHAFEGRSFRAPKINISIYSVYEPGFLKGQIFYASYPAEEQAVLDKLSTVHFE